MRKLVTMASVVALAAGTATCGNSPAGTNSASNILPMATLVSPSALEARAPGNGNGKGKGGGNGNHTDPSALTLVMVNDVGVSGPSWNDTVTFDVATTATNPLVSLNCYQGSSWVYAAGGYQSGWDFTLAAYSWPGGAADCTATLFTTTDGRRETTLAELSFHVYD